jgi:hypothetical protein
MKEPAEMNNVPVNVEQVMKDMVAQVEAEEVAKTQFDKDAVDTALLLEGEMDKRIREAVAHAWNNQLRTYVETRIQEEVAELGTRLGRQIHQLVNGEKGGRI